MADCFVNIHTVNVHDSLTISSIETYIENLKSLLQMSYKIIKKCFIDTIWKHGTFIIVFYRPVIVVCFCFVSL